MKKEVKKQASKPKTETKAPTVNGKIGHNSASAKDYSEPFKAKSESEMKDFLAQAFRIEKEKHEAIEKNIKPFADRMRALLESVEARGFSKAHFRHLLNLERAKRKDADVERVDESYGRFKRRINYQPSLQLGD